MERKALLTIAGFDPSGGAGVTLDIGVFAANGFRGMGLCTAMTVQNSVEVKALHRLPPDLLLEQYRTLREETVFHGIKVGMLGGREHLRTLSRILENETEAAWVVDPVLRASSGARLMDEDGVEEYLSLIRRKISLVTPNIEEASRMTGFAVQTPADMREAAVEIHRRLLVPCVVTGGHLSGTAVDVLYDGRDFHVFERKRVPRSAHGTGCFFSSSMLCLLVRGLSLPEACARAGERTVRAIGEADAVGRGGFLLKP
jgi:hydroxymethylpyrimidine/phosphomethylpyrimidine kinase